MKSITTITNNNNKQAVNLALTSANIKVKDCSRWHNIQHNTHRLLGQFSSFTHVSLLYDRPTHGRPPFLGRGFVQLRDRMEVPVSHRGALQRPCSVQEVHPPCTGKLRYYMYKHKTLFRKFWFFFPPLTTYKI